MANQASSYKDQEAGSAEAEAYSYLLSRIRKGDLAPGSRIRAEEVATEIGMSRMPVREAIGRLSAEGLLTIRPNRGAIVTDHSRGQILEMFEIRSVLEGLAIRHAVQNVGSSEVEELRDLLFRMDRGKNDCDQWLLRHWAFHSFICKLSGRDRLFREIERLHVLLEPTLRFWFAHINTTNKSFDVIKDHQQLIDAMMSRDANGAEAMMRRHILETAHEVIEFLNSKVEP